MIVDQLIIVPVPIYAIRPQVLGSTAAVGSNKHLITVLERISSQGSGEFEGPKSISSLKSFPSHTVLHLITTR